MAVATAVDASPINPTTASVPRRDSRSTAAAVGDAVAVAGRTASGSTEVPKTRIFSVGASMGGLTTGTGSGSAGDCPAIASRRARSNNGMAAAIVTADTAMIV